MAEEAGLMPVLLFVRKILGIYSYYLTALVTIVGENIFITLNAKRDSPSKHICVRQDCHHNGGKTSLQTPVPWLGARDFPC